MPDSTEEGKRANDEADGEVRGLSRRELFGGAVSLTALGALAYTYSGRGPVAEGAGVTPVAAHGHGGHGEIRPVAAAAPARPGGDIAPSVRELEPFRDPLPIPPTVRLRESGGISHATVEMKTSWVRLHSQLPRTRMWAYDGHYPGPTIDVRRGQRLRVTWTNDLSGEYPLPVVELPFETGSDPYQWDRPGKEGGEPRADVAALPPWVAVHLHGALTGGGQDGWPENAVLPGDSQISEYANDQPSATLWYHDHAMHITHLNVLTGLTAGMYLIRDDEEKALDLPSGRYEIPLVLSDHNLDTDTEGRLNGGLLYKTIVTNPEGVRLVRPFTGPYSVVNGVIWPHLDVEPRWYRFRLLNAANMRPYSLSFADEDGNPMPEGSVVQIGADAGLLPTPVTVDGDLIITPAERIDLLVDFSAVRGRKIRVTNEFATPPVPYVMEFRVGNRGRGDSFSVPGTLSKSFTKVTEQQLADTPERLVMVTPVSPPDGQMWEMERTEAPSAPLPVDGIVQIEQPGGEVVTYRRTARMPNEVVNYYVEGESWERWTFLSLEPSAGAFPHPMHLHATAFQVIEREQWDVSGFQYFRLEDGESWGGGTVTPIKRVEVDEIPPEERGWKDVVQLWPGQRIVVAPHFTNVNGRYVYHCHNYEHEDMGMMRPFVVMPSAVLRMDPHGGGGHH
ncbi:multicopper oxidase family protein [Prauserella cavernicola]|uniref:Multicopper oxidase domain-containing protein n=1 Tax=Prauserella cavernicola TaxID=2800127 RepID=A0A934V3H8_9PSEU|nr:multicopper oxidase domain-containing protein [Prauserella cavernicola]MBK1783699.1 multicopper oxidase domain-containing protein [Prauserella cavernicola]